MMFKILRLIFLWFTVCNCLALSDSTEEVNSPSVFKDHYVVSTQKEYKLPQKEGKFTIYAILKNDINFIIENVAFKKNITDSDLVIKVNNDLLKLKWVYFSDRNHTKVDFIVNNNINGGTNTPNGLSIIIKENGTIMFNEHSVGEKIEKLKPISDDGKLKVVGMEFDTTQLIDKLTCDLRFVTDVAVKGEEDVKSANSDKTKWIITGSVLGAAGVIGIIIVVIICLLHHKCILKKKLQKLKKADSPDQTEKTTTKIYNPPDIPQLLTPKPGERYPSEIDVEPTVEPGTVPLTPQGQQKN